MPGMFRSCDRCENPASVHLTEIRDGQKTERHLCENCARTLHLPAAGQELQKLLKTFEPAQALTPQVVLGAGRACPDCGLTYAEFRQHGRFGCARDYEVFATEIAKLLERIHGHAGYTGKAPGGGVVKDGERIDDLALKRRALQDAIRAEDYEQAARLRDEIRRLGEAGARTAPPGEAGDAP